MNMLDAELDLSQLDLPTRIVSSITRSLTRAFGAEPDDLTAVVSAMAGSELSPISGL